MTILAVDHGSTFIGLAISDPDHIVARPLAAFAHISRKEDAAHVAKTSKDTGASAILLGTPTDSQGTIVNCNTPINRFVAALKAHTPIPIYLWDESDSTFRAQEILGSRYSRQTRPNISLHSVAAAVILQDYLDAYAP